LFVPFEAIYLTDVQKSVSVGMIIQKQAVQATFDSNTFNNVQKFKCLYLQEEKLNYDVWENYSYNFVIHKTGHSIESSKTIVSLNIIGK
jgi:hypothetical protein